jgi:hypothetical protein
LRATINQSRHSAFLDKEHVEAASRALGNPRQQSPPCVRPSHLRRMMPTDSRCCRGLVRPRRERMSRLPPRRQGGIIMIERRGRLRRMNHRQRVLAEADFVSRPCTQVVGRPLVDAVHTARRLRRRPWRICSSCHLGLCSGFQTNGRIQHRPCSSTLALRPRMLGRPARWPSRRGRRGRVNNRLPDPWVRCAAHTEQ